MVDHVKVDYTEKKQLIDDELRKLAPENPIYVNRYSLDHLKKHAPNYYEMLEQATNGANSASKIDGRYVMPPAIFLTSSASVSIESLRDKVTGSRGIILSTPYVQSLDFSALLVQHEHEVGHQFHGIPSSIKQSQLYELEADWHANAVSLVEDLLARSVSRRQMYDGDASQFDHPNLKTRMVMALLKELGYGQMWGHLTDRTSSLQDHVIEQPFEVKIRYEDGYAVNQEGLRISNWATLESAIHAQVKDCISAIDQLVKDEASPEQQAAFIEKLKESIVQFKKEHPQHEFYFFNLLQAEVFKADVHSAAGERITYTPALSAAHQLLAHIERELSDLQEMQSAKILQHAHHQIYQKLVSGELAQIQQSSELG